MAKAKKAVKKDTPLTVNMSFEEALRRSITTRAAKKTAVKKKK